MIVEKREAATRGGSLTEGQRENNEGGRMY